MQLEPEPRILIESLRDIGYSFNSALADIVDNSITAKARNISILAIPSDDFRIAIIDDGEGLGRDELMHAMRLGSTDPRCKAAFERSRAFWSRVKNRFIFTMQKANSCVKEKR